MSDEPKPITASLADIVRKSLHNHIDTIFDEIKYDEQGQAINWPELEFVRSARREYANSSDPEPSEIYFGPFMISVGGKWTDEQWAKSRAETAERLGKTREGVSE